MIAPIVGDAPEVLDGIDTLFSSVERDPFGEPDREEVEAAPGTSLADDAHPAASLAASDGDPFGRLGARIHTDASVMHRNAVTIARHLQ